MENHSQRELLNQVLKKIKKDVTANDRKSLIKRYGFTHATISIYLNGKGLNSDTGLKIYQELKSKISKRNKMIQDVG